jgi:hypothetical protein
MVDGVGDAGRKVEMGGPPPAPSPFFTEIVHRAMGEQVRVVSEEGPRRGPVFQDEARVSNADEFGTLVEHELQSRPVLAVPAWYQERTPIAPVIGQELVEKVRTAETEHSLGILVPVTSLASHRGEKFREALLSKGRSILVLEAYKVLERVDPRFLVCLVVLHQERSGPDRLARFVRVPRDPDVDLVFSDVDRLLRMAGGSLSCGFVHRGLVDPFAPLTYQHYDPVLRARTAEFRTWGEGSTLGELFDIAVPAFEARPTGPRREVTAGRFVTGRFISNEGRLEVIQSDTQPGFHLPLLAGDFVMQAVFSVSDRGGLKLAEVAEDDLPAAALHNVVVLRPKRKLAEAERLVILHYLRSNLAKELAVAAGAKGRLAPSSLARLYIPVAEEPLLRAVESIVEAGRRLRQWADDTSRTLDSIFALESPNEARLALIERGRESRLRVDAAGKVDDFDYRVRTLYPYPVAYRWRSLESVASIERPSETLREIRHGFEHILAFCGCLALALAREDELDLAELRQFGACDGYQTFLSTWTIILDQVASKVRRNQTENQLLVRLGTFQADEAVAVAVERLSAYRRAESHTLAPAQEEELVEQLLTDFQTLVHGLRFLADYEVVEIVDAHWDRILRRSTVRLRAFVGDHPNVPVQSVAMARSDIETNSLYIREKESGVLLAALRPYLVGRRCLDCNQWATFYLHEIKDGKAIVKSIELGHPNELGDLAEVLRSVARESG